ncbi:MAG: serine protease [Candidatus Nanopelagicales bacterium]
MRGSTRLLTPLVAAALVSSVGLAAPVSAQPDPQDRVINGRAPTAGEFGSLVALATKAGGLANGQFCGGTLVSSTVVVTAAHCLVDKGVVTAASTLIVGSTVALDSPGARVVNVAKVTVNPGYNETTTANDVAVLTLASPLNGIPTVPVVSATEAPVRLAAGAPAASAGWGNTSTTGENYPNSFLVADLVVFPNASCGGGAPYTVAGVTFNGLGPQDADPTIMVCADGVNAAGQVIDTCQGDSGGPLLSGAGADARLVGVVSFGVACAGDTPGVYTRLSAYLNWLSGLGVPIGGGTTPPPTGEATVVITSPADGSAISSGGLFGVSATTTGVAAGTPAFLTLNGSAKASTTVQANGNVRFDNTAVGGGSWIPAEAGDYAVRICGSTCGPVQATSETVSLDIVPFQIVGDPAFTAGLRFTVATGNWAPGTRIYVTRNGVAAGSGRVVRTGERIVIQTQDRAGTYQVRVSSHQGYVYGNQAGVVTLN